MATYKVAWKASTKQVKVLRNADALGSGFSSIGTFDHDDDADDILGNPDDNHTIYHHVQERLYHQNVYDMQSVEIKIPVGAITSLPATDSLDLSNGETVQITNTFDPPWAADTRVTYTSSDPTKATVDANGLVTPVAIGTTTITVTAADGYGATDTCAITVVA